MISIILAAGKGTRLMPLTKSKPKCMVELNHKPLLKHQIDVLINNGIKDINVIGGYLHETIDFKEITLHQNPEFAITNMVYTLFCARELFEKDDNDILISYGDIVFNETVCSKVINSDYDIAIAADLDWKKYWSARMENPLDDAETLKFDQSLNLTEVGLKPNSYDEIMAQYIGLIKISNSFKKSFLEIYDSLDKTISYEGKDFNNMYMTTFLNIITNEFKKIKIIPINNGWMEIDTESDLSFYSFLK